MRRTSIDAYNKIKAEGLLSQRRWQVYEILFQHGPLTAGEIFEHGLGIVKGSVCARLTELREMGIVYEYGEKKWSSTGHVGILWDVNDRLPEQYRRGRTKDSIIKELINELIVVETYVHGLRRSEDEEFLNRLSRKITDFKALRNERK